MQLHLCVLSKYVAFYFESSWYFSEWSFRFNKLTVYSYLKKTRLYPLQLVHWHTNYSNYDNVYSHTVFGACLVSICPSAFCIKLGGILRDLSSSSCKFTVLWSASLMVYSSSSGKPLVSIILLNPSSSLISYDVVLPLKDYTSSTNDHLFLHTSLYVA